MKNKAKKVLIFEHEPKKGPFSQVVQTLHKIQVMKISKIGFKQPLNTKNFQIRADELV